MMGQLTKAEKISSCIPPAAGRQFLSVDFNEFNRIRIVDGF